MLIAEPFGRAGLVVVLGGQRAQHELLLDLAQGQPDRNGEGVGSPLQAVVAATGEVLGRYLGVSTSPSQAMKAALHHVAQLADVTRPGVRPSGS